jgi:hypothetical protein
MEINVDQLKTALVHYENTVKLLKAFPFSMKDYYRARKVFREDEARYVCWQTLSFFQGSIVDIKKEIDNIIGVINEANVKKDSIEVKDIQPAKAKRKRATQGTSAEAV